MNMENQSLANNEQTNDAASLEENHLTPEVQKLQKIKSDLNAREAVCDSLEALTNPLEETTLQQFDSLCRQWHELPSIPPEYMEILEKRFKQACDSFTTTKEHAAAELQKRQELEAKLEQLCKTIEKYASEKDPGQHQKKLEALKKEWKQLTADHLISITPYEARFTDAAKVITDCFNSNQQQQQQEYQSKKEIYQKAASDIEAFLASDDIKPHHHELKTLKNSWHHDRTIFSGQEPDLVHHVDELFRQYFEKLNLLFQEADWQRWENYTLKEDLVKLAEKVNQLENLFEASNLLKDIREKWKTIGTVPREKADEQWERFNNLCNTIYDKCHQFFDQLDHDREEHYQQKVNLCVEAEALKDSSNWHETADKIKAIQESWKQIGPVPKEKDHEIWERFNNACNTFFENRRLHFEELKIEQDKHKQEKEQLCEKAESLAQLDWKQGFHLIHQLREQWKQIDPARCEDEQALWERFNSAIDKFYEKIDQQRPINLEQKLALCDAAEKLLGNLPNDVHFKSVSSEVDKLMKSWKEIGPVDKEKEDEIWERFNKPIKAFNLLKHEFFEKMKSEKQENLNKKIQLIEKIEELVDHQGNWNEAAEKVKTLQTEWKKIGPVPREQDKAIWERYNSTCNAFFSNRRDFFHSLKEKKDDNLKHKIDLCIRLEHIAGIAAPEQDINNVKAKTLAEELTFAIMDNSISSRSTMNRRDAVDEVKRIQREWKQAGPIPKADDKELYKRFRRACDAFFGNKKQ